MIKQLLKPLNLKFSAVFGAQPRSSLSHKMSRPLFEIKNQIFEQTQRNSEQTNQVLRKQNLIFTILSHF